MYRVFTGRAGVNVQSDPPASSRAAGLSERVQPDPPNPRARSILQRHTQLPPRPTHDPEKWYFFSKPRVYTQ